MDFTKLDRAWDPRCVVVVGDTIRERPFNWLHCFDNFKGKLYSVQIDPKAIEAITALGITNYTSLLDIPEPEIDLVVVAVPRAAALKVLEDCIRRNVGVVHFFTSGFSETDTEEGRELERKLASRAMEASLHIIGPNCMGIFSPKVGVKQNQTQYDGISGPVGLISQSGTHAIGFSREAHLQGIDISKSVSFGNGTVLDSPDYLEYLANDPETKVIGMYLEGVKDGRRFFEALKRACTRKPVVIWKGGRTEEGGRAIASHTGSLAVSHAVWDAALRQCGAIGVANLDELIDTLKALLYLEPVYSDRVAIAGGSGGQTVAIADVFAEAGLKVPPLSQSSYDEFATFFSLIGGSYRNPIDTGNPNRLQMKRIMDILERDGNTDNLVLLGTMQWYTPEQLKNTLDLLSEMRKRTKKPLMSINFYSTAEEMEKAREVALKFQEIGVPVFPKMERGAQALRNALKYYDFKRSLIVD
ncbi:MAG: CoA-binding protein [Chloroflexota bacterium]